MRRFQHGIFFRAVGTKNMVEVDCFFLRKTAWQGCRNLFFQPKWCSTKRCENYRMGSPGITLTPLFMVSCHHGNLKVPTLPRNSRPSWGIINHLSSPNKAAYFLVQGGKERGGPFIDFHDTRLKSSWYAFNKNITGWWRISKRNSNGPVAFVSSGCPE